MSIVQKVREAGIVGAGGAGFPTHVKFESKVHTAIANGAECEPLLQCDKAVMQHRTEEVLQGLTLLAKATSAARVVIALKGHYRALVNRVREVVTSSFPHIEVYELGNFYPAGDEQVLVQEVTKLVVPEGGIPLQVGVVVNNVITLSQVAQAVNNSQPVIRRALTIAGEVRKPLTCELPIGTPLKLAIELAGGATVSSWAVIEGGPMMGRLVTDVEEPITKRTSGILVLPTDHPLVLRKKTSMEREVRLGHVVCCQCRMCTDLCPRFNLGHDIYPHLAMRSLGTEEGFKAPSDHVTSAFLCCMCGVCEVYACPLGLSPRRVYEHMQAQLTQAGQKNPHKREVCVVHDFQKLRQVPLPRLVARLGLTNYVNAPYSIDWKMPEVTMVRILLLQHVGAPALPIVKKGQAVVRGDLIGDIPKGKLGACVHASINGTVVKVDKNEIQIQRD
ncbi:MAG: 4Fe-4S dicluster domain-containing protein [Pseudomonadota bacterium]